MSKTSDDSLLAPRPRPRPIYSHIHSSFILFMENSLSLHCIVCLSDRPAQYCMHDQQRWVIYQELAGPACCADHCRYQTLGGALAYRPNYVVHIIAIKN